MTLQYLGSFGGFELPQRQFLHGFFTSGSAAIPNGGSIGLVKRMRESFESLGGKVHVNSQVASAEIVKENIKSINVQEILRSVQGFIYELYPDRWKEENLSEICYPEDKERFPRKPVASVNRWTSARSNQR